MKIFGLDISLDHGGIVVLDENGKIIDYRYLTTVKKMVDVDPGHSILLTKQGKDESKDVFRLRRMQEYLQKFVRIYPPNLCISDALYSIEGYSYSSKSTSICQIAELTGHIKYRLYQNDGKIRIQEPKSLKLFATGKGDCLKKDIVKKASLKLNIPEGLIKIKKTRKKKTGLIIKDYDGPATDVADAYFLARMLYTELEVRAGKILLSQLNEGERRIFLRVTKAYPVNILDRPFICKGE